MDILLITVTYPPEIRSISLMMREVAEELRSRGNRVTVVTSFPRSDLRATGDLAMFSEFSVENGVKVIRVMHASSRKGNYLARGIVEVMLPHFFFTTLNKYLNERIDAVIVYSPPLPLSAIANKIKKRYGAKYLLNVQDIFPQNAIDLGIIKNRLLIRFFEWIERRAYNEADRITAHSESNRKFLIFEKRVPERKTSTIYNWIDFAPYEDVEKIGLFRKKYRLEKKFIFLHAGIIGPAQGLDFIIQIARVVRDITEICFLLVGDGSEKQRLAKLAKANDLKNVVFKPFVSGEEYPLLAKDADVGLTCLSNKNRTPVYPGKLLGYMAASIPVVAFLNKESDGHYIIQKGKCGYSYLSEDCNKGAELILKVYKERESLTQLGCNGYEYAIAHFSKKVCIDKLEKLLQ